MILCTQYYRPPFPEKKYWKDDMDLIKKSGINTIQLWALWGWIENEPGIYRFDDYDELFTEAGKRDLNVIISSIAEIQPYWIHREISDSYMIDNMGNRVISSNRGECNHGLTPGGCTDNPEILKRMGEFLSRLAERYKNYSNFIGWDCWNELRWDIFADNLVCFCPYTQKAFQNWLKEKYIDIDGLNIAWKRRYCDFSDVRPGKNPGRPYTEMMEFQAFLQARAARHMKFRYNIIKGIDPGHIVTAHGYAPSIQNWGSKEHHALNRGNDWDFADILDGIGCSHFPFWNHKINDVDFAVRVESIRSAAGEKVLWVSELQGGAAKSGFKVYPSVRAKPQQRWVWNGIGRGAKAIIFWCWRDEVFGCESSGFGLAGMDGFADERLAAMKETGKLLIENKSLLKNYKPDKALVAVLFSPDNYTMEWAQDGIAQRAGKSIIGYASALERNNVLYDILETYHLDNLKQYKLIIIPFPFIIPPEAARNIVSFVNEGGTLLVEGECDAFSTQGFYRYPGKNRKFVTELGIEYIGRRDLEIDNIGIIIDKEIYNIKPAIFQTPLKKMNETTGIDTKLEILSEDSAGNVFAAKYRVGKGNVYALGAFAGLLYADEPYVDFEKFVNKLVNISISKQGIVSVESNSTLQWRTGMSGNERLLFVINTSGCQLIRVNINGKVLGDKVKEIRSGQEIKLYQSENAVEGAWFECNIDDYDYMIFRWVEKKEETQGETKSKFY